MSEVCCRVRGSIVQGEPWDAELLREGVFPNISGERRCASVFSFKSAVLVSGDTSSLHILADSLVDMLVNPLLELLVIFWYLALLLWPFMHMAAAGVFFAMDPITPLIIEDVPQVSLVGRRSLAMPRRRTRSTATYRRRARSPSIPELLLEPLVELFLLLDEEVLGHDSILERIFMVIGVGLVMGLRHSQRGLLTWLGNRFLT